ncbi:MAG: thioesterase family protein [Acidimicrobiales bacterium]
MKPTPYTTGPWRADAQHGGAPAALLGRSIERLMEDDESLARISVELIRPVPLEPLTVEASRSAVSRRVSHIGGSLRVGHLEVARVMALVLRGAPLPPPRWEPDQTATEVPGPDKIERPPAFAVPHAPITYHRDAVEHRLTEGAFGVVGPATDWIRLLEPLVEGEDTSSLCRLLAAVDFGSGISRIYGADDGVGMINADLTVAFARPPMGEWIRLASLTRVNDRGTGLATTEIGDENGYVGVATQSLLGINF